jgi:hypothetical protein
MATPIRSSAARAARRDRSGGSASSKNTDRLDRGAVGVAASQLRDGDRDGDDLVVGPESMAVRVR